MILREPFHIQWHITNHCNLLCRHCYQEQFSTHSDLNGPDLKRIAGNVLGAMENWNKTAGIYLTGGEPLLKPELFPLLDYLDQQQAVTELGIITNGLLFGQEWIERCRAVSKLKKIKVSLDGATAETHDMIRSSGTFERVIKSLSLLTREGGLEVIIMFTVMERNVKDLLPMLNLCRNLGVKGLVIERFIPLGRGRGMINEVLSREDWRKMTEVLFDVFSVEEEDRTSLPYQAFQVSLNEEEPELWGAPCVIGKDGLCVMPNGDVFPCRRFPISIGSLLKDSLKTIWEKSEILKQLSRKENLKGKCGRCETKDCRGCRSLAFALTGDYLAEDLHCLSPEPFPSL